MLSPCPQPRWQFRNTSLAVWPQYTSPNHLKLNDNMQIDEFFFIAMHVPLHTNVICQEVEHSCKMDYSSLILQKRKVLLFIHTCTEVETVGNNILAWSLHIKKKKKHHLNPDGQSILYYLCYFSFIIQFPLLLPFESFSYHYSYARCSPQIYYLHFQYPSCHYHPYYSDHLEGLPFLCMVLVTI